MAGVVGKYAAQKLLGKELAKYKHKDPAGPYDPLYTTIPHPRKPGKTKKVKKQIPAYIPEHDAEILAKVRSRAYKLDCALFSFLGTRFGYSSLIGLVPAAGDVIDVLLALLLLRTCTQLSTGLPASLQARMALNIAVDFVVGLIPFLGDLVDAFYKCNTRNCRLLEEYLDATYKPDALRQQHKEDKRRSMLDRTVPGPPPPATVIEEFSDDDDETGRERAPAYWEQVRRPEQARVPVETRGAAAPQGSAGKGWFGRARRPDVETGR